MSPSEHFIFSERLPLSISFGCEWSYFLFLVKAAIWEKEPQKVQRTKKMHWKDFFDVFEWVIGSASWLRSQNDSLAPSKFESTRKLISKPHGQGFLGKVELAKNQSVRKAPALPTVRVTSSLVSLFTSMYFWEFWRYCAVEKAWMTLDSQVPRERLWDTYRSQFVDRIWLMLLQRPNHTTRCNTLGKN